MERFEIVYKCTECDYEITQSYRELNEYGEWRSDISLTPYIIWRHFARSYVKKTE